ncbi:MAG TPA: redoxin family protein [Candidatus Dormibacteraeota bacterium]|jgi:thiol-disulfide isomerase/thioredoxin|nr:redoxin family protein [Candidatus Dormibacteraeota bacterium]
MRLPHPYRWALGLVVALVAALAIGVAVARPSAGGSPGSATSSLLVPASERQPVPDFTGLSGWVNSPPLHESQLRGNVVLIDFWTFSCVNCTRTIPHLRTLDDTYRSAGLVVVGVHSPEFDFEKDPANVAAAVRRLGVTWPVAIDSGMATWNAFGNQYWPAEYLVDRQGKVAYFHPGEGDYGTTEKAIVQLLGGAATPVPAVAGGPAPGSDTTPELYAGSLRGSLGDGETYGAQGARVDFPDRGAPAARDRITLAGPWVDHAEYLEAAGPGHVRLRFHASDLYVVGGSASGSPLAVRVNLDGAPVPAALRGPDLTATGLSVSSSDLRHVLTGVSAGDHVVDLTVPAGFQLYTFTFG